MVNSAQRSIPQRIAETALVLAVVVLSACSSASPVASGWGGRADSAEEDSRTERADERVDIASPETITNERVRYSNMDDGGSYTLLLDVLSKELDSWLGTPHVLGGTTRRGVDCSALVQRVYAGALGVNVPRTTAELERSGEPVSATELRTGDLVFFRPDNAGRHVGIYMANNDFIHASSSRGVMRSNLREAYWERYYTDARRILHSSTAVQEAVDRAYAMQDLRGSTGGR